MEIVLRKLRLSGRPQQLPSRIVLCLYQFPRGVPEHRNAVAQSRVPTRRVLRLLFLNIGKQSFVRWQYELRDAWIFQILQLRVGKFECLIFNCGHLLGLIETVLVPITAITHRLFERFSAILLQIFQPSLKL